jgi:hypothetical protein
MILTIQRLTKTAISTCGVLTVAESLFYTLELPAPIAAGTYRGAIAVSPHLSRLAGKPIFCPHLYGVPGFVDGDILIHYGNDAANTEGCILVGLTRSPDWIGHSDAAFAELMGILPAEFSVVILDPPLARARAAAAAAAV